MTRHRIVTLEFLGDLPVGSFAEFAAHRAARLSLVCRTVAQDPARAVFSLQGAEVLIDAFEMALSLGPHDCLVHDVHRHENAPTPGADRIPERNRNDL